MNRKRLRHSFDAAAFRFYATNYTRSALWKNANYWAVNEVTEVVPAAELPR